MSRQSILSNVSVMEKLTKLRTLPTLRNVIQGYFWRQHELKAGKGPNFQPAFSDIASLVENDIRETWVFANLGTNLLSSQRIIQKIKCSINHLSSLKAQPKSRLQSPSYLNKLESFEKECEKIFDICSCKCNFTFDSTIIEEEIPCTDQWRTKIVCSCPMATRIHPRELKFLLDQRTERKMMIGSIDKAVTSANLKKLHHSNIQKRARFESDSAASNSNDLQVSFDDESSSMSGSTSEFGLSESEEENASMTTSTHLVSSSVCKLTDRKLVSLRSTSDILNDAATTQGKPANKRSHMTVYRRKRKFRDEAASKVEEKMKKTVFQVAFDGKKLLAKERFAVLAISKEGNYLLGLKTFKTEERCTAEACSSFMISVVDLFLRMNI